MKSSARSTILAAVVLAGGALFPGVTLAQSADDPATLLEEFIHYTRVAKPDLAASYGQKLLDAGYEDERLAEVVDDAGFDRDRLDKALQRALRVAELESVAGEIVVRIENGRLSLAREASRIEQAIAMLGGTQRQKILGEQRLEAAGEYAVPALLKELTEGRDEKIKIACVRLLESRAIGRMATAPLATALPYLDPETRITVCRILGNNGYSHAGPALRALALDDAASSPEREAAQRAFDQVLGGDDTLTALWTNLGEAYFVDLGSLVAYPFEDANNVWHYDSFVGLVPTAVPTAIFNEIMAMRCGESALAIEGGNRDALALYVASNLKRENELPDGEADPIYGDRERTPAFYATVFGTGVCQEVLGLAIDATDTPLVRDAIAALSQTTGGANLFSAGDGRRPLLEALTYPDRRVQYEAALTLGAALPQSGFPGDHRVVPLLSSAVRTGDDAFALIVADDGENLKVEADRLERLGYTIIGADASVDLVRQAIDEAVGVDVIVLRMNGADAATQAVSDLRRIGKTLASPIMVIAPGVDVPRLRQEYRANPRTRVTRAVSDDAYVLVLEELLERAAGGKLTEAEAEEYAIRALSVLRDVAISRSPAYDLADAETALLDALDVRTGGVRLLVAEILALLDSETAQMAIFDAALDASDAEQIALLDAATDSVRRYGDRAERRHLVSLLDLVAHSTGDLAEAAARLHGALNLRESDAVGLILGDGMEG